MQVARDTVGVRWVRDRMFVRPLDVTSDAILAERIRAAWRRDPYLRAESLQVEVHGGIVRIAGTTDTTIDRARAESVAYDVPGVIDVINNVDTASTSRLTYSPYLDEPFPYDFDWYDPTITVSKTDEQIASEVRDQLWWSPFVDSDAVKVTVDDGVATLEGRVGSWGERRAAIENALQGGAVKVIDRLRVGEAS